MSLYSWLNRCPPFWYRAVFPSLFAILFAMGLQGFGLLSGWELGTLDRLMRGQQIETKAPLITLVVIGNKDIQAIGKFPIPNHDLMEAVDIIQAEKPRVLGLSFLHRLENNQTASLETSLNRSSNVVMTAELSQDLNKDFSYGFSRLPLSLARTGFVHPLIDNDGKVRRSLLVNRTNTGNLEYAFSLQLARLYLAKENIFLHPIDSLEDPIYLGDTRIPQWSPIRLAQTAGKTSFQGSLAESVESVQPDQGNQMLLNFSTAASPFPVISFSDLLAQRFDPALIHNRIVILGAAIEPFNQTFQTAALSSQQPDKSFFQSPIHHLFEIEMDAYATHQLLNSVLSDSLLVQAFPQPLLLLWILLWGISGIILGWQINSLKKSVTAFLLIILGLHFVSFQFFLIGYWIPILPTLLAMISAMKITVSYQNRTRALIKERRATITQTFESLHNGPLQTLALLSRQVQDRSTSGDIVISKLASLNRELRDLYEQMENQHLSFQDHLFLNHKLTLDLKEPLSELLFQVSQHTLARPFPSFRSLQACMTPNFSPLDHYQLTVADKRALCLFLEEALCNIGKYGLSVTYIKILCEYSNDEYSIEIINNQTNSVLEKALDGGYGTHQANRLANQLNGHFQRFSGPNNTLHCQLKWPVRQTAMAKIFSRFDWLTNNWLRVLCRFEAEFSTIEDS